MSSLEHEFTAAVKDAELQVFIELIRARPSLSLAEIAKMSRGRFGEILSRVSVGQLIEGSVFPVEDADYGTSHNGSAQGGSNGHTRQSEIEFASRPVAFNGKLTRRARGHESDELLLPNGDVNTRTPAGRQRYDERVMEIMRSSDGPMTAPEIWAACKGTPLQVRKALARLIAEGEVAFEGKARATRYATVA